MDYIEKDDRYSNMQQVAAAISGYEHLGDFTSAKCDYYYELKTKEEKLENISEYAMNVYNIFLKDFEILKVYDFLELSKNINNQNDRWTAFEELK